MSNKREHPNKAEALKYAAAHHVGYMKAMRDMDRDIDKTFIEVLKWKLKEEKEK